MKRMQEERMLEEEKKQLGEKEMENPFDEGTKGPKAPKKNWEGIVQR
jgi:hypothetical protein